MSSSSSFALQVLEDREVSLRSKVLGSSILPSSSALVDRLCTLHVQLNQLTTAVSGSTKLFQLYQENSSQLQLASANAFVLSSSQAGDELKRAAILSSTDRLQQVAAQLQQLHQLTSVLDQLRTPDVQQQTQLTRLETTNELLSERALAFHSRVENMLASYQRMMLVLSEKCVEYSALLDHFEM
ncbi:unnamed protein product [Peronospora belbahrii]|uniref:Uncharacterized protein n=1 Tax=Peronospora belbahrii TaxID=622444 RepID=A0AAU9LHR7_9STRA|nr:unnamed protein product [Peronospora belbahrii]CAH0522481.1 unnamed protein product [Peronospora belbahrii]